MDTILLYSGYQLSATSQRALPSLPCRVVDSEFRMLLHKLDDALYAVHTSLVDEGKGLLGIVEEQQTGRSS